MRLRWLIGNFADPQYRLPRSEQKDVSWLAHERYMPGARLAFWTVLTLVLPTVLLITFAVPPILRWLGYAGGSMAHTIAVGVVALLAWPISAVVYGHLYAKPVRRAMRDRGYDICVGCGYLLNELPPDVDRCPECGRPRESDDADSA